MPNWSLTLGNNSGNKKGVNPEEPMTIEKRSGMDRSKEYRNPDATTPGQGTHSPIKNFIEDFKKDYDEDKTMGAHKIGFVTPVEKPEEEKSDIRALLEEFIDPIKKVVNKLKDRVDDMEVGKGFAEATCDGLEGEELFKKLPHLGRKAVKVLKDPPRTWDEYLTKDECDFEAIYEMEAEELKHAMEKAKDGRKSVDKELTHVMAALLGLMIEELKND